MKRYFEPDEMINKTYVLNQRAYTLVEKLGAGGVGIAYKAIDTSTNKAICIKVLNPRVEIPLTDELIQRFYHEVTMTKTFDHPNIVQIYDVRRFDGYHSYSMEYCPGGNLKALLRAGKIGLKEKFKIFLQISEALNEMHKTGMHRDLKPDNILLNSEYYVSGDQVHMRDVHIKVSDFGTFFNLEDIDNNPLTLPTDNLGSLIYISPEQKAKKALDQQTDIYALGLIFYQLLKNDTSEYRLKPLTSVPGLDPEDKLALQNMIYKMCATEKRMRYRDINSILVDLKKKVGNKNYHLRDICYPGFIREEVRKTTSEYPSSNSYSNCVISDVKVEVAVWDFSLGYFLEKTSNIDVEYWPVPTEAVISKDIVIAAWENGYVSSLSLSSGSVNWVIKVSDLEIASTPVIYRDMCFVCDITGRLYSLHLYTGRVNWTISTEIVCTSPLKVIDGYLFLVLNDKKLMVVDLASRKILRQFDYTCFYNGDLKIDQVVSLEKGLAFINGDEIVCYPNFENLDTQQHQISWWLPSPVAKDPYMSNIFTGVAYDVEEQWLYVTTSTGQLLCVDAKHGDIIWKIETLESISAAPFVNEEFVYFTTIKGYLYHCDKRTGATLEKYEIPRERYLARNDDMKNGVPIVAQEYVALISEAYLKIYDTASFGKYKKFSVGDDPKLSPAVANKFIIVSSNEGISAFK